LPYLSSNEVENGEQLANEKEIWRQLIVGNGSKWPVKSHGEIRT